MESSAVYSGCGLVFFFFQAEDGIRVAHEGLEFRRLLFRSLACTDWMLPRLITDPNPTPSFGHRKAKVAAPNPDRPSPKNVIRPRLKNCRRVTPIVSGSVGTKGAGGALTSVAIPLPLPNRPIPARCPFSLPYDPSGTGGGPGRPAHPV